MPSPTSHLRPSKPPRPTLPLPTLLTLLLLTLLTLHTLHLLPPPHLSNPPHQSNLHPQGPFICPSPSPQNTTSLTTHNHALVFPIPYLNNSNYKRLSNLLLSASTFTTLPLVLLLYPPTVSEPHLESLLRHVRTSNPPNQIHLKRATIPFNITLLRTHPLCPPPPTPCHALAPFTLLHVFTLLFRTVLVLDWRIKFLKPFHHLLLCPSHTLLYTPSTSPYLDPGILVIRSNNPTLLISLLTYYESLLSLHQTLPPPTPLTPLLNSPHHFLHHYFLSPTPLHPTLPTRPIHKTAPLSPCLYLFDADHPRCEQEFHRHGLPIFVRKGRPHIPPRVLFQNRSIQHCLVDAWLLGPSHAAIPTLYNILISHPDVRPIPTPFRHYTFPPNETDHIIRYNRRFKLPSSNISPKHPPFSQGRSPAPERKFLFDAAPFRLADDPWPVLAACAHRTNRFAVMLREPVARCVADVRARRLSGGMGVRAAIEADLEAFVAATGGRVHWMDDALPKMLFRPGENCLYDGVYAAHLKRWFYYVGREQVYVGFFDRFYGGDASAVGELVRFFGLEMKGFDLEGVVERFGSGVEGNGGGDVLPEQLVRRLDAVLLPYKQALETMLGVTLSW